LKRSRASAIVSPVAQPEDDMARTAAESASRTVTAETHDTMWALVVDHDAWDRTRGFRKTRVARPTLDEHHSPQDGQNVIVQVLYAGVCGTDRSIYDRRSLRDTILKSLEAEGKSERVLGHELVGRIAAAGSEVEPLFGYKVGQIVSTESHVFCGRCYQCRLGQTHICSDDRIIGVSRDGGFAEYIKLPARVLWPTDTNRIALEVAAIQEPFGNAVHACTRIDLRGKTVGVFGTGTIGLFATMIAKPLGAARVIGIDPAADKRALALRAGADAVLPVQAGGTPAHAADAQLVAAVQTATAGVGLDVALEMAGFNSSVNNAIQCTRRGGDVVLFGLHSGDFVIERFERVIMNGLTLTSVIGRELFRTWTFTQRLLEDRTNGIQAKVLDLVLNGGRDTVLDIADFEPERFEAMLGAHPKILLRFARP
jgi:threonine 3-dehydrogenase